MSERQHGLYSLLCRPGIYDFAQSCIRSQASRRRFFAEHVRPGPDDSVLDIGCGTGDALSYLTTEDYVGIDLNPHYVTVARKRYPDRGQFLLSDVMHLREQIDGPFDVALALGVLHHLADDVASAALESIASLLSPTGRLVTHDPVLTDSQSRMARWFVKRDRGPHVRREADLVRLVRRHFGVVRTTIVERPLRIPYTEIVLECEQPIAETPLVEVHGTRGSFVSTAR